MSDQLLIYEIVRVSLALDQCRDKIGHVLDLSDAELDRIQVVVDQYLSKRGYCE